MRFQVPQFVDIEDRIIGPFTLKQFLMYVVAAMLLVPVYVLSDMSLFITVALPVMGIAAAFAHLKVNGLTLAEMAAYSITYYTQGQLYIWRRPGKLEPFVIRDAEWTSLIASNGSDSYESISSLDAKARTLETEGKLLEDDTEDPLDSSPQSLSQ